MDRFVQDSLPPRELWPDLLFDRPELQYPARFNCAAELLDRHVADGRGGRTAILAPGLRWSYAELLERANRIARALVEDLGVEPGNRVLLRAPNNPTLAACWFAVMKAGAVAVTTMPLLRARELRAVIDKAKVGLALCDASVADGLREAAPPRLVCWPDELDGLAAGKPAEFDNWDAAADDPALIAFTSGTTGGPKGTVHFHRDVLAAADLFPMHVLKPTPDDLFCGSPPLAFTFGLGGLLLFPARIGAASLLLEKAAPEQLLAGIAEFRATIVSTAPTAYRAMLPMLKAHDVSSLRRCVSAGEHLPQPTWRAWFEATGVGIIDGIGATEMLHIFIASADDEIRPGSTGKVVPGYQARIVDDAMREVPRGAIGRLAVRGPTGCRYLADERQKAYVRDGWNLTGDAFTQDADGYFWYQSRTDDLIVSAGYNISAAEVEEALLEHGAVKECGVIGAPDPERGMIVKAFVVLREGTAAPAQELQAFVKARIAPYKYPRAIVFLDALPCTETGKLQRYKLRELSP